MDAARLFDSSVFGLSAPKLESCLGLYLSADAAYLTSVRVTAGRPAIEHMLRLPIPQKGPAGKEVPGTTRTVALLNNELLTDPERMETVLRQAVGQLRPSSPNVVVSLSQQFGLLRYFTVPPMDSRFWRTAVPAEAKKHIPIPFNELMYDFQIHPVSPGADRQQKLGVLFGVIPKRNLDGLLGVLKRVGLTPIGVELAPCSVERLWDSLDGGQARPGSYAHVHIDNSEAMVLVSQNGWPILFRTVQLSSEASPSERRKIDLPGSIDFVRKQLGAAAPAQVRVSGNLRDMAGWNRALADEMESPVRLVESVKALGLKSEEWGAYAAIGGALRYLMPSALTIDLMLFGRISDEDRRGVYALFTAMVAAILVLGAISMLRYVRIAVATSQVARLRRQVNSISEFKNKSPSDIGEMLRQMEKRVEAVNSMILPRMQVTHMLESFAEDVPESVWINELEFSSSIGEGNGGRALAISGHAMGASMVAEQDLANQFREKLQADPRIDKIFVCGTPRTQSTPETRAGDAASPEALARARENRSTYAMECSFRNKR